MQNCLKYYRFFLCTVKLVCSKHVFLGNCKIGVFLAQWSFVCFESVFWSMPMSFSSNSTASLCSKVKGEVMGSSPIRCMCNLPIKKIKRKCVLVYKYSGTSNVYKEIELQSISC
jgi:hypothetical protein